MSDASKSDQKPIIETKNLSKYFPGSSNFFFQSKKYLYAVKKINIQVQKGETLGLVGESGSGKSTLGKLLLKLINPSEGSIFFQNRDINDLSSKETLNFRRKAQIIFQDPYSSLNPRITVNGMLKEIIRRHKLYPKKARQEIIDELLQKVGLSNYHASLYPHEFSGGQRQRIAIARAISLNPQFIVADEPVSALDVSIQAQIINLMKKLQEEMGLAYLFISHDLSVVKHISHRIAVMYLGEIVEIGSTENIFASTAHPYTASLLKVIPRINQKNSIENNLLKGDIPNPVNLPTGCPFHPRCPKSQPICKSEKPALKKIAPNHFSACLFA